MRMSGDHPNFNIDEIGQNAEESPGYLKRLALSLILVLETIS